MAVEVSEPRPGITLVVLNNPGRRNALSEDDFRHLAALWPSLDASEARCIVLTGAGEAFCSGADLSANLPELSDIEQLIDRVFLKTAPFRKPMVAAINGDCVAGGLELAMACDIRICAISARLGFPEARWGIFPAGGGAIRLAAEIGHAQAAELMMTGRLIDGNEAMRMGLVNRTLAFPGEVLPAALDLAEAIARNSPVAVSAIKQYMSAARRPAEDLLTLEKALAAKVRASDDAKEGARAFLEKGMPDYKRNPG